MVSGLGRRDNERASQAVKCDRIYKFDLSLIMKYGKRKRPVASALAVLGSVYNSIRAPRKHGLSTRPVKRARMATGLKRTFRKPGSKTRTRTVTLRDNEPSGNVHSAISVKSIRVGNFKKCRADSIGKWQYQQTYRFNLTSIAGLQGVSTIVCPMHLTKILTSSGPGYATYQNYTALEALNPYIGVLPLSAAAGGPYGNPAIPQNDKFVVETVSLQVELSNFAIVPVFMDVYVVCCKKNTLDDATTLWQRGLALQALGQNVMSQPQAVSSGPQAPGVEGYPLTSAVHVKPNDGKLFGQFYKIHRVKKVMLTGGASETLNIDIGINRVVDTTTLRELSSQSTGFVQGLTWQVFVVQRGTLVEDTTQATGGQLPTYGGTKVGCILQEKVKMCGVKGNTTRLNTSTEYSNIPYGQSAANQQLLNVIDNVQSAAAAIAGI